MDLYSVSYSFHARKRLIERHIAEEEIDDVLEHGVAIETYEDDGSHSCKLLLHWSKDRPLHVVVITNESDKTKLIITAYEPDEQQWEDQFRRRKP